MLQRPLPKAGRLRTVPVRERFQSVIQSFVVSYAEHPLIFALSFSSIACAACSPWSIIGIQYTTRKELASLAQVCAKKTLQPNGFEVALQCHMDTIGFDYEVRTLASRISIGHVHLSSERATNLTAIYVSVLFGLSHPPRIRPNHHSVQNAGWRMRFVREIIVSSSFCRRR